MVLLDGFATLPFLRTWGWCEWKGLVEEQEKWANQGHACSQQHPNHARFLLENTVTRYSVTWRDHDESSHQPVNQDKKLRLFSFMVIFNTISRPMIRYFLFCTTKTGKWQFVVGQICYSLQEWNLAQNNLNLIIVIDQVEYNSGSVSPIWNYVHY